MALLVSQVVIMLGAVAVATPSFSLYCLARVVTGIGVGGAALVKSAILIEVSPTAIRGDVVISIGFMFPIGILLNAAMAWGLMPPDDRPDNEHQVWRLYTGLGYAPVPLIFGLTLWLLPESPRYLLSSNKLQELNKLALHIARVNNVNGAVPESGVCGLDTKSEPKSFSEACGHLFSRSRSSVTIALWFSWFTVAYMYYGLIYGLPKLFDDLDGFNSYLIAILGALTEVPGTVFVLLGIDHPVLGRRYVHILLFGANALVCIGGGFSIPLAGFVVVVLTARMLVSALFTLLYLYTMEIYPTSFRGK